MSETKTTSIRLPADLLKKARDLGLNISKVCENCLRAAVRRLEGYTMQTQLNGGCSVLPVLPAAQTNQNPGNPHSLNNQNTIKTMLKQRVGSLARIGHEFPKTNILERDPPKLGVAGSNPVPPAT